MDRPLLTALMFSSVMLFFLCYFFILTFLARWKKLQHCCCRKCCCMLHYLPSVLYTIGVTIRVVVFLFKLRVQVFKSSRFQDIILKFITHPNKIPYMFSRFDLPYCEAEDYYNSYLIWHIFLLWSFDRIRNVLQQI